MKRSLCVAAATLASAAAISVAEGGADAGNNGFEEGTLAWARATVNGSAR